VIESATGKPKAGRNIFCFEIRQLYENLLLSEPIGKQVQNINHPNPYPTDARLPSALCKIGSDALDEFSHDEKLPGRPFSLARIIHEASTASADTRLRRAVSRRVCTLSRRTFMNNAG
jgi:hypothetical protein